MVSTDWSHDWHLAVLTFCSCFGVRQAPWKDVEWHRGHSIHRSTKTPVNTHDTKRYIQRFIHTVSIKSPATVRMIQSWPHVLASELNFRPFTGRAHAVGGLFRLIQIIRCHVVVQTLLDGTVQWMFCASMTVSWSDNKHRTTLYLTGGGAAWC